LIADDEQLAREELHFLLRDMPEVEIVGDARNGLEAVELTRKLCPDIVLLDIQMPGLDGFQVVGRLLSGAHLPHIIFVTAYDEYALRAFEVNATDYLLKPVDQSRLEVAIRRAIDRIETAVHVDQKLQALLDTVRGDLQYVSRLPVQKGKHYVLLDAEDILYAHVLDGVVSVVTDEIEGLAKHRTLDELESDLDPRSFRRVHRSYLANINRIAEIIPRLGGTYWLRMDDTKGTQIPLSRSQARELRKVLRW